jgi:TniQ
MISSKLVVHPAPRPTESLPGYVLRLTEANGYASPSSLFRLAGMMANETSFKNFECSKFALIANLAPSNLERMAFTRPESDPQAIYLLGNHVSVKDLNLSGARMCPECVVEKGFIEAHWHIDLMVACPTHRRAALWWCAKCHSRLSWLRPRLLECKCGTPLLNPPCDTYSEPELALLDLIRLKALGDQTRYCNDLTMPMKQLDAMSLQEFLAIVRFLGKSRLIASWSSKQQDGVHLLRAAARVLTNWPFNFEAFLKDICPYVSDGGAVSLAEDFANIYKIVHGRMTARFQRRESVQSSTTRSVTCSLSIPPHAHITESRVQEASG